MAGDKDCCYCRAAVLRKFGLEKPTRLISFYPRKTASLDKYVNLTFIFRCYISCILNYSEKIMYAEIVVKVCIISRRKGFLVQKGRRRWKVESVLHYSVALFGLTRKLIKTDMMTEVLKSGWRALFDSNSHNSIGGPNCNIWRNYFSTFFYAYLS